MKKIVKRVIDVLAFLVVILLVLVLVSGGFKTTLLGAEVRSTTPLGPAKVLIVLILVRVLISIRIHEMILLVVSLGLSLGVAEYVLRVLNLPISQFQLAQIHRPSAVVDWEPIPNASSVGNTGATYRINSHGCRGPDYPRSAPEGQIRILAIGDSFTFGMGVESEETYPKQLERQLGNLGVSAEVINCGVIGHDMWQHDIILRKTLALYQPDIVIFGVYYNDLAGNFPPDKMKDPNYKGNNPFAKKGSRKRLHNSYLYNTIRNAEDSFKYRLRAKLGARQVQGITERRALISSDNSDSFHYQMLAGNKPPKLYKEFQLALEKFVAYARNAGSEIILIYIPDSVQLHDPALQRLNEIIKEIAKRVDVPLIDPTGDMEQNEKPETLYLFPDDAHNSAKGLGLIANAILQGLQDEEMIPARQ